MAVTVTQRPQITSPAASKWNAVGNPIVYKFTRKDFLFNQINDVGGAIEIQINGSNQTANFTAGDKLWLQSDNGVYSQAVTVFSSAFSTNTTILCTEAYISAAPGGYVNNNTLRPLYKLSIGVYSGSTLLGTNAYSGNKKGEIIADVSRPLWSNMSPDIDADLTGTTDSFDDISVYKSFYIKYTETWIGSANSETNDSANIFYAVYGARQIPALYGGNMFEYVTNQSDVLLNDTTFNTNWSNQGTGESWILGASELSTTIDQSTSQRARRSILIDSGVNVLITIRISLIDFDLPTINLKVYLSNGQIVDFGNQTNPSFTEVSQNVLTTSIVTYIEVEVDNSTLGSITGVEISDVDIVEVPLNKFLTKLDSIVLWRGFTCPLSVIVSDTQTTEVYLSVLNDTDSSDNNYTGKQVIYDLNNICTQSDDEYTIVHLEFGTDIQLSEEKKLLVRNACENAIMLLARNTLGGCLSWVFDVSQDYTFEYADGRKGKRLVLFAEDLTLNEWEALQDFITLGEVYRENIVELTSSTIKTKSRIGSQVYAVDQAGNKIGVTVIPTKNTTKTRQVKHKFEIEIEYPEEFNA